MIGNDETNVAILPNGSYLDGAGVSGISGGVANEIRQSAIQRGWVRFGTQRRIDLDCDADALALGSFVSELSEVHRFQRTGRLLDGCF